MMLFGSNLFFSRTVAIEISKSVNTEVVCKKYSNEISPEREEYSTDKYRFQTFNGNFETKIHSSTDVIPVFNIPNVICYGNTPPILPNTSLNNISGNWSPSIVSNINSGTYTFTPNNSNDTPITITINIIQECDITLSWSSGVSCQLATEPDPDIKDNDANIVDGPCIRVCENSTITYSLEGGGIGTINFTEWLVTGGTVSQNPIYTNNTTCTITWGTASYSSLQGIIHLNNGTTLQIDKCIEKLAIPNAQFGILPNLNSIIYTQCLNSSINFENLTTNNGGNEVLYYNWDFGDGTTSNEFEPSHIFASIGDYIVSLHVFNGCSCSSEYQITVKIENSPVIIQCPSVVCEGERTSYSIAYELGNECSNINWNITGGHQVGHNNNFTQIDVVWNNVDQDGFGYIAVNSTTCFSCSTPLKIPVIKQDGTIIGSNSLCPESQGTYSLPQWASTTFDWTIDDGGTGAIIINNNNRNEIIVKSQSQQGTINLYCTYFNTVLGCGGNAQFSINVKPFAQLEGLTTVCQNTPINYNIIDENGSTIPTFNWTIEGPNGYSLTGTQGNFQMSFPSIGIYNFAVSDDNYCSKLTQITVKEAPAAPVSITGSLVVCPGIPITYSCTSSANSVTHWEVVGGTILGSTVGNSISVNFDTLPSTLSTYTVKVWYEGELCNSGILSTIIHRDVPVFNITTPNTTVCGSTIMNYSAAYTTGESYLWTIVPETAGSVQSGQNSSNCTILWNQANTTSATAVVKLEIRKCGGTYPATYNVTIINKPDITIIAPSSICAGESFNPTFNMSAGTAYTSVTWDYGDGTIETITPPNTAHHTYLNPITASSSYTVVATVHGGNGCVADAINHVQITVATSPIIDLNLPDVINICNNHDSNNAIFQASVNIQSGFSATNIIQWYKEDGTGTHAVPAPYGTAAIINVSNISQGFGAGHYWATVTNSYNCTSTTAEFVVVEICVGFSLFPTGPGSGTPPDCTNCTYDYNIEFPCQSVAATISNLSCTLISSRWGYLPQRLSDVITSNTNTSYSVTNLQPGKYKFFGGFEFDGDGIICTENINTGFTIPYKADVRYSVTCNNNSSYNVTVLDHSVYYPQVGIGKYEFTTNGGTTWIDLDLATEYLTILPPGTYTVGVRISQVGFTACIATTTLVLPNMPSAAFTHDTFACQDAAMQFTALDTTPGLQYEWEFPDEVKNLQQNPVRTFNGSGTQFVKLKVTNQYGCFTESPTTFVNVKEVKLKGAILGVPETACEGSSVTLNYTPKTNPTQQTMPTHFTWYHNDVTNIPFATTTTPSLTVNQSGQYFVYVQDSNGCNYYQNDAVSVAFIPVPTAPIIKGNALACVGSPIRLSVPNDPAMQYIWSVNDVVNHAWDNLSQIEDTQTSIGNYSYSVVAQVDNTGTPGSFCSSSSGTFNVNVVAEPNVPQLSIDVLSCNPYQVRVTVVNPQTGANYHWSNGFTGLESTITHDGPLQVRAEVYNCGVTAQLDLPRDLSALAWTFPKGCYAICADQPLGYIVGPLGVFTKWDWLENSNEVDFGSNSSIKDLHQLQPDATYQLHLNNGYCETTLGSASFYEIECNDCAIEYDIKDIKCININGINLYSVTLSCNNPYGTAVTSVLTTPGGEGHFDSSVLVLPAGYSLQTTLFYAISPFQSGLVTVNIQSHWRAEVCNSEIKIDFPVSCSELMPSCNFKYDLIKISCIETSYGAIYDIEIAIFNPYPIQATTTLSVPNGEGYLVPATMQLLPGDHTYHFSLYPLNGFHGGSVDLIFGSGFANLNCIKLRKYNFPALCSTAPRTCDFDYEFTKPRCQNIGANVFSYQIDMSAFNPTGSAATMTLMAPNGEGYFVSNNLLLPPYGSNQSFYFYPSAGFQGGLVTVTILVHFKEKTCYSEQTIEFKDCSATNSIDGKMGKAIIITANLLRIAPNPAKAATTIFYNFENKKAIKTIELTDVLGRTLKTWMPTEASGAIELDCSIYTNGQYLILMKEDQKVIETAKLITN